jgi:tetratricopeptide (TPR) repeat protein
MSDAPQPESGRRKRDRHFPRRRWVIPPILFRDPDAPEPFEGVSILREVPQDLGLALYQVFRDLLLWAMVPEDRRPHLFATDAALRRDLLIQAAAAPPHLRGDLEVLSTVLRRDWRVEPAAVTGAALRVSRWAADLKATRTALMFAQAASAASPQLAPASLEVGRVAADCGRFTVAETWLRRAVGLARRAQDWESYSEALIVLSRLYSQHPSAPDAARARATALTAARMARRHGLRLSGARARLQLSVLTLAAGNASEAEEHARRAFRLYSRQHPDAPAALHLVAESMLAQRQRMPEAIQLLQKVLPHRRTSRERFGTLMILIRAAARVRDRQSLESSWSDALSLIESLGDGEDAAGYLFQLASVAADALEHRRATEAARRALQLATERRDSRLVSQIRALIEQAQLRTLVPPPILD